MEEEPTDPGDDPTDPGTDPTDPTDPGTDPTDPTNPTDPGTDPTNPTDPGNNPTEPGGTTDPGNLPTPVTPSNQGGGSSAGQSAGSASSSGTSGNLPRTDSSVTAPKKVKLSSVKNRSKKSFTAVWKKVQGAAGYQIQYAVDKKFKKSKKNKNTSKLTFKAKKLKKKKTYYVRVRAYVISGGKKVYGKWSAVRKVKIKK